MNGTGNERGSCAVAVPVDPASGKWLPIATAPKDGTPIIIAECTELTNGKPHWYVDVAVNHYELDVREKDTWIEREGRETVCDNPTHWMPLPAPPEITP